MPPQKIDIVRRVLPEIPPQQRQTEDQAMKSWWENTRDTGGLRLTRHGHDMMKAAGMASWVLDLAQAEKPVFTKKIILAMDRRLNWPYFLDVNARQKRRQVVFFGSQEALMATMYGDLRRWLDSLQ